MNIGDFLHSKRWKLMQNYIYSWGASVVLIGALFKLEHLPYASVLLGVGLSIEAIIFFVSAFEPMMEMPDWKVVYPQMRTGKESKRDLEKIEFADKNFYNPYLANSPGYSVPGPVNTSGGGAVVAQGTSAGSVVGLPDEQMNALKESLERLAQTANGLKNISDATTATESFVKNLNEASESIGTVVNANKNVATVMEESVKGITVSYQKAAEGVDKTVEGLTGIYASTAEEMKKTSAKANANIEQSVSKFASKVDQTTQTIGEGSTSFVQKVNQSADEMTNTYKEMATSMSKGFKGFEKSSGNYAANLDKINKNMSAINATYELHLKGTTKVEDMVKDYAKGVGEIGKLLNVSVEEAKKFNQNTKEINENIQALNNIYGKMLGALNSKR